MNTLKKPGYMFRACVAWVILNTVLLFTLAALVYILKDHIGVWYVMIPIIVAVVVSEWVIMGETIAPIVKDWIKQEEYVKDGEKPSWSRT
jgi:hypothetical protein